MGPERKRRILVIAPKSFPCDHSFLENVFAQAFPKLGMEVFFVLNGNSFCFPWQKQIWRGNVVFVRPSIRRERGGRRWIQSVLTRMNILLIPFIIQKVKPDFIFVRTEVFTCLLAIALSTLKRKKARVFYHYNWPFYEKEYQDFLNGKGHHRLIQRMERIVQRKSLDLVFRRANHIFSISSSMRQKLIEEGRIEAGRISPMSLAASEIEGLDQMRLEWRKSIREAFGLDNKFVVVYIGSLSDIREAGLFLEIAAQGKTMIGDTFHLMIIGAESPAQKASWVQEAAKRDLSEIISFVKRVPREKVPEFLCAADVGLSPIPLTSYFEVSSPTKVYEYMAAGCPFVSSRIPEVVRILQKAEAGILADHSAVNYALALKALYDDEALRERCSKEGLRFTKEIHNYRILSSAFLEQIAGL
jgi:glycosyltransferase involved in cell wall biosynthesis